MKRMIAIAFSTLALAATAAQAGSESLPQPSFVDFVAVAPQSGEASKQASPAVTAHRFPQPSFVDYVGIEEDPSAAAGSARSVSRISLPQPSFSG
jgi:hypothetical protein